MSVWLGENAGAQIRLLRKRKGWRLADLATASGFSLSWISDLERGRTDASLKSLEKLSAALGAEVTLQIREAKV